MIQNPVLPGFHADPSIICVDGVFYIANSTFEYYPGVKISASEDLANWRTIGYPLKDKKHIDMKGNPQSTGVWAPCLSYSGGMFYLTYTDVKTWMLYPFKDTPNYITSATEIDGEWSDPVYINSSGFDPSLFHDDDGRKYFVNMEWDYREPDDKNFTGILLTELDAGTLQPISEPVKIFPGSYKGSVEGPHLYKKDGFYYLFTAEGGTSYEHAETVARSESITGPYELHPDTHLVTTTSAPESILQKTGHGSLCMHPDGRYWFAFLCGRPIDDSLRCPLGRETGIAEITWHNNWPYLKDGGYVAPEYFEGYGEKTPDRGGLVDFCSEQQMKEFQSLRVPAKYEVLPEGFLRLYGGESLASSHEQNMLVRRQDCRDFTADACVRFAPQNYRQMAGLIYRYDEENQFYLRLSWNDSMNTRAVGLLSFDKYNFKMTDPASEITVGDSGDVWLRVSVEGTTATFSCSVDGTNYQSLAEKGDVTILSDEYATPLGFTGAFIGMECIDLHRHNSYADFVSFSYCRN